MMKTTIKQIIPAVGWNAAYRLAGKTEVMLRPLACFALCDGGDDEVVGDFIVGYLGGEMVLPAEAGFMVIDPDHPQSIPEHLERGFICYIAPGESTARASGLAAKEYEHELRRRQYVYVYA